MSSGKVGGASHAVKSGLRFAVATFFEYDTPKIVHISSKKVGIINRIIQLTIIAYVIGFVIVYKKGYQDEDTAESAVTTKVKGVIYTDLAEMFHVNVTERLKILDKRIWDVADYVNPPQERGAFFVMTNMIVTPFQYQSTCPEDTHMAGVDCDIHNKTAWPIQCPPNTPVVNGNGVRTGKCVTPANDSEIDDGSNSTGVCQIYAWCPVEVDELPIPGKAILNGSKTFTVLIKNSIDFTKFGVKRRNILERASNKEYLQKCRYNASDPLDKFCPIFELGYIIKAANEDYDELAIKGGVIAINIDWDCNLDYDPYYCTPAYSFRRLDQKNTNISAGWNFRYANYFNENDTDYRTLVKAYGIRFLVIVSAKAGKFNVVPLFLNLGSGLALLGIATVLCDIVVLYVLKKRHFYESKKYLNVVDDDAFQGSILNDEDGPPTKYGSTDDQLHGSSGSVNQAGASNRKRTRDGYSSLDA